MFEDRHFAGKQLAVGLLQFQEDNPVVYALAPGGVPVGFEVAKALNAQLDALMVQPLLHYQESNPSDPYYLGCVAPGEIHILNAQLIHQGRLSPVEVRQLIEQAQAELENFEKTIRNEAPYLDIRGRSVILVDDGLSELAHLQAAIKFLESLEPRRMILAVPVCIQNKLDDLELCVHHIVCLDKLDDRIPEPQLYEKTKPITNDDILFYLNQVKKRTNEMIFDISML